MKNNKGFTLIELLAVILILGIIALVAVPKVTSFIEESKKNTIAVSVNNLIQEIQVVCYRQQMRNDKITTLYTFNDGKVSPTLEMKGKLPDAGTIEVDESCNVKVNYLLYGEFKVSRESEDDKVIVVKIEEEKPFVCSEEGKNNSIKDPIKTIYLNPETGNLCNEQEYETNLYNYNSEGKATGLKTGCMRWYVYSKNNDGTYNALLDHNTTGWYSWNSEGTNTSGPDEAFMTKLQSDTSTWLGISDRTDSYSYTNDTINYTIDYTGLKARIISAEELLSLIPNGDSIDISTAEKKDFTLGKCMLEYQEYLLKKYENVEITEELYNNQIYYEFLSALEWYAKETFDDNSVCKNENGTQGYWTSTASLQSTSSNYFPAAYGVGMGGENLDASEVVVYGEAYYSEEDHKGIRPVITIPASLVE